MYCSNCGKEVPQDARFCTDCGTKILKPINKSEYVEKVKEQVGKIENIDAFEKVRENVSNLAKTDSVKKKRFYVLILVVAALIALIAVFASGNSTVDEACDWCGHRPSVEYKTSDGFSYVCESCSEECVYCGADADKKFETYAGIVAFVCDDCYDSLN